MNTRVVTISRQVGTGGEEVAQAVAASLGLRFIDYQVIQQAAEDAGEEHGDDCRQHDVAARVAHLFGKRGDAIEAAMPRDAVAGTRYAAPMMQHLDSEK